MASLQVSSLALPDACAPLPETEACDLQLASDNWPYTSWRAAATWLPDQDHCQKGLPKQRCVHGFASSCVCAASRDYLIAFLSVFFLSIFCADIPLLLTVHAAWPLQRLRRIPHLENQEPPDQRSGAGCRLSARTRARLEEMLDTSAAWYMGYSHFEKALPTDPMCALRLLFPSTHIKQVALQWVSPMRQLVRSPNVFTMFPKFKSRYGIRTIPGEGSRKVLGKPEEEEEPTPFIGAIPPRPTSPTLPVWTHDHGFNYTISNPSVCFECPIKEAPATGENVMQITADHSRSQQITADHRE
eukprot:2921832-Pyramimonas_sp.AAC.4